MKDFFRYILLVLFLSITFSVCAQTQEIRGRVVDSFDKDLQDVVISIKDLNRWSVTDKNGRFHFTDIPDGDYILYAHSLSYKDELVKLTVGGFPLNIKISLNKLSLALEEVVVTAENNRNIYSSSIIKRSAIDHVQASSLEELMHLVPGGISSNPVLSDQKMLSMREVVSDNKRIDHTSSLGTAIIIDGQQLSNDANMQMISSANINVSNFYLNNVGGGFDLRSIPSSNIESVEIIRGVASVQYGDLTSGAVIVKTKAGYSPLKIGLKTDPYTKSINVGQGFVLNKEFGFLNYDLAYTRFLKDIRTSSETYNRYNATLKYSNVYNKNVNPISLNLKFNVSRTVDDEGQDKDAIGDESHSFKETRMGINLFGNILFNKSWITNLKYSFNTSYSLSKTNICNLESISSLSYGAASAMTTGENRVPILDNEYYSNMQIDGKPLIMDAKLSASLTDKYGGILNNLLYGVEWRSTGNLGDGRSFDPNKPYNPKSVNAIRTRSFKDIPFINSCSFFLEDKISLPIASTRLDVQFGLRLNHLSVSQGLDDDYKNTLEPRINAEYAVFDCFSIRGGYGVHYKNPTMMHLYPDNAYLDKTSYNNGDIYLLSTKLVDRSVNNIIPAKNTKTELGFDFHKWGIRAQVTAFYEKLKNGFSFEQAYDVMSYNKYAQADIGDVVDYNNGNLFFNGVLQSPSIMQAVNGYSQSVNSYSLIKKGIEYTIDFGKIKAIETSITIDGAYFYNKKTNEIPYLYYKYSNIPSRQQIGVYPEGDNSVSQRFNTNFRFVTHIPKLRMVFSLTAQVIWSERYKVSNDNSYVNDDATQLSTDPFSYLDMDGVSHTLSKEEINTSYDYLVKRDFIGAHIQENYPITSQINLKVNKEIGDIFNISFYANNVFYYVQKHKLRKADSYIYRNQPLFFGAMLKMSF